MLRYFFVKHNNGDNLKILITGATSGIAYQTAKTLAQRGHFVYATSHTDKQTELLKEKLNGIENITVMKLDITKEIDRKKALDLDIDVLYNHAGIGQGGSILEADMNEVRNNFEVNVFSSFQLLQDVLKQMIKKNKGRIVVMSSLTALTPLPFVSIYSATKASISTITRMLQIELKLITNNIKVVLIEPGMYHTGFNQVFLENKYDDGEYFQKTKYKIYRVERIFFKIGEKKELDSIVDKIIKAIEEPNPKNVYRAPLFQAIGARIINIFK